MTFDDLAQALAIEGAVATHQHPVEVLADGLEHFIDDFSGADRRLGVAGSIAHGETLAGGSHRHEQRVIRPGALV